MGINILFFPLSKKKTIQGLEFWPYPSTIRILASVVQRLDSAIPRVNLYLVDSAISFPNTYSLDSDLYSE